MTDTPDLMSIGDFSSRSRLSVRMLRHYGEHGILVPADVDAASGYRRYAPGELPQNQEIWDRVAAGELAVGKAVAKRLEKEGVAFDIGAYRLSLYGIVSTLLVAVLLTFGLALIIEGMFRHWYGVSGQPYPIPQALAGGSFIKNSSPASAWVARAAAMSSIGTLFAAEYSRTMVLNTCRSEASRDSVMESMNLALRDSLTSSTVGRSISSIVALVTRSMERSMRRSRGVTNRIASPVRRALGDGRGS